MGKILKVSNSRIKAWRRCHNLHHYKYNEDIEPRKKAAPLIRGSMLHEMDDAWLNGEDWRAVLGKYGSMYMDLFLEEREEYGDIIGDMERVMEGYIAKWSGNDLKYIKKKGRRTEHGIEVELIPGKVLFVGKIDRIGEDRRGNIWLVEKKSFKKKLPKEEVRFTDLQTTFYYWGAPLCGFPIPDGIMWDYVRAKPPVIPQLLKKGGLSRRSNIDSTYETYLNEVKKHGLNPKDYKDILDTLKEKPDQFHRRIFLPSPDQIVVSVIKELKETSLEIRALGKVSRARNFNFDCGQCGYYSLCQAELRGLDSSYIRRKDFRERGDEFAEYKAEEVG